MTEGARRATAVTLAVCGTELLLARASGGLPWTDVGAACILALGCLATRSSFVAPIIVSAGVLIPALWSRGIGVCVWMLLTTALVVAARRGGVSPRAGVATVAAAVGVVWVVVGIGQGQAPALADAALPVITLALGLAAGRWVVLLAPLALVPERVETWSTRTDPTPVGPDVLLVTVDTLRYDAATEMRSLKKGELREGQAVSPWTLPSLATIHTGLSPGEHGAVRVPAGFAAARGATLAERFRAAGWDTAATVESPFTRPELGLQRGFERVRADGVRPWAVPRLPWSDRAHPTAALLFAANGGADQRAQDVRDFVDGRRERPMFVWAHVLDPHLPYRHALELDLPLFERLRLTTAHRLSFVEGAASLRVGPAVIHGLRTAYRHEVRRVDAALIQIRAAMPDALFLVTSDHGEEFGEHGGFEHGHSFYQELLSVPVYAEGVELPPSPFGTAAIAPAILASAGLQPPTPQNLDAPSTNLLYGSLTDRAVRRGAAKLIEWHGRPLSFDLAADPAEWSPGVDGGLAPALPTPPDGTAGIQLSGGATEALRALGYVE